MLGGMAGEGLTIFIPLQLEQSTTGPTVLFPSFHCHDYRPRLSLLLHDGYGMVLVCPEEKATLLQILR